MPAVSVRCPNCGASLDTGDDASSVTCTYCGTAARIQPRSRIWQVLAPLPAWSLGQPQPVARQRVGRWILVPVLIALAAVVVPLALVAGKVGKLGGLDRNQLGWWGNVPVLADVDGDGSDDLIGFSRYVLNGDRMHVAAFSGATGKKLWETPRLGTYMEVYQGVLAAAGDVVVLATPAGALRGFDRATGAARWEAKLGEKVEAMCAGDGGDAIVIGTADHRWYRIALADGRRSDAQPLEPLERGPEALRRVTGERAPGWCEPLASSARDTMPGLVTADSWSQLPAVDGMRLERVVRRGDGPVVAIGPKQPGSAVPMLAVLAGGQVRWQGSVPASDPLNSRADDNLVTVSADAVFAIYEASSSDTPPRLTAFALADGRRLWDVAVAKGTTIVMTALVVAGPNVVLSSWGHLQAFDRATGQPRFRVGRL